MMSGSHQIFGKTSEVLTEENLRNTYGLNVSIEEGRFRQYASFEDESGIHRLIY